MTPTTRPWVRLRLTTSFCFVALLTAACVPWKFRTLSTPRVSPDAIGVQAARRASSPASLATSTSAPTAALGHRSTSRNPAPATRAGKPSDPMSKFNPTNYTTVSPAQDDVVLLWQRSTNSVKSATVASLSSELQLAETIDALKAIATADLADGSTALVNGYYAAGDGGGGSFYYDQTSGATDNGGTVIAPDSGTGRWLRV